MGSCGEVWETGKTEGHEVIFEGNGYFHCLDCKEMFTSVKMTNSEYSKGRKTPKEKNAEGKI